MQTLIANGAVMAWAIALIFAPAIVYSTFRRCTPLAVAGGGMATMVVAALLSCLVSLAGYSPVPWLRALCVLLAGALALAAVRAARAWARRSDARRALRPRPLEAVAVLVVVGLIGMWMFAPLVVILSNHGLDFGLLTHGNADESNYVLAAQNMTDSGFRDSHHLANGDMGDLARTNYFGAITMLVFVSAMTPLGPAPVALVCMALATSLAAVSLWALATEIWPTLPPATVVPCVLIPMASGIAVYSYASYFLGAQIGLATVSAAVAGAVSLAREWSWPAAVTTAAAGGYGVYAYGHIGLPVLVLVPVVGVFAALVTVGPRGVPRAVARVLVAVAVALVLAIPTLRQAYALMRAQSTAQAGWSLPPMGPIRALLWPQSIGLPSSGATVAISWVLVLLTLLGALAVVARRRPERRSALLAGLVLLGTTIVVAGAAGVYGADRYQSWKMMQFLLPVGLVAALPAVALVRYRGIRLGAGALTGLAGAALLGPWLQWSDMLSSPETAILTSPELVASVKTIQDRDVEAVNVRLPDGNQTMMAGAMMNRTAVVLTQNSYYAPLASARTCTLTIRALLDPGETDYVPLSGDYVLLERPAQCLVRR